MCKACAVVDLWKCVLDGVLGGALLLFLLDLGVPVVIDADGQP